MSPPSNIFEARNQTQEHILKVLLDARSGLHDPRARLAEKIGVAVTHSFNAAF